MTAEGLPADDRPPITAPPRTWWERHQLALFYVAFAVVAILTLWGL